ncbi:MAG: uracil-DNA glycosylase [Thermoleophilia bacterium]|nr:uracil-DNA glycosylase [Thermoleophilia bacterium]
MPATGRHRSLAALQRDCRVCRACAETGFPIASTPVFEGGADHRALLIGQAPGAVEAGEGRPWCGRAGRTLRRWLDLDEESFYRLFYCTSVTRCYPGKAASGRGDRLPSAREADLCRAWLDAELRLLRPALVVTAGGLAARRVLGLDRLSPHVGERLALRGAVAIALPHPSGASAWPNDPANSARLERATALVRAELALLAEASAAAVGRHRLRGSGPPGHVPGET